MSSPKHLSTERQELWRAVVAEFELEAHELELLRLACEALDRAAAAREALDRDGVVVDGKSGPRLHPMYVVERDARLAAARLLRQLALDAETPAPPNRRHRAPDRKQANRG